MERMTRFDNFVTDILAKKRAPARGRIQTNPYTGSQQADIEDLLNGRPARDHLKRIRNLPKHKANTRTRRAWD